MYGTRGGKRCSSPVGARCRAARVNAFIALSYIDGEEGRDSLESKLYLWRTLGKYAELVHSIGVHGLGLKLSEITEGDSMKYWLRYLEYNSVSLTKDDALIQLNVLTLSDSVQIKRVFENLKGREFRFGLNHGDLSLKNVIVDRRQDNKSY